MFILLPPEQTTGLSKLIAHSTIADLWGFQLTCPLQRTTKPLCYSGRTIFLFFCQCTSNCSRRTHCASELSADEEFIPFRTKNGITVLCETGWTQGIHRTLVSSDRNGCWLMLWETKAPWQNEGTTRIDREHGGPLERLPSFLFISSSVFFFFFLSAAIEWLTWELLLT